MIYNIRGYFGGLGDQLQFSCMPEYLSSLGHQVKLYVGPDVMSFRNQAIKDFVWGYNPFIYPEGKEKPLCESAFGPWNMGDVPNLPYINTTGAFISNWEAMHGLEPKNVLPKIYYTPKTFELTKQDGLIELSGISMKYNPESVKAQVRKIIANSNINWRQVVSDYQSNYIELPEIPKVKVSSLEELSDLIHNCKSLITLNSGVHSLAAAIQRFGNVCSHYSLIPEKEYEAVMANKKFIYPNIIYLKCG